MKATLSVLPDRPPDGDSDAWIDQVRLQAELLDGIEVGLCAFDLQDRAVAWNRSYLRMFPEHDGHIERGEPYATGLRRFYQARLGPEEIGDIERYIEAGTDRHRAQSQPFEFEHHGLRLQVSSLPVPGRGRIRVWRAQAQLPPRVPQGADFAAELGSELLEYVPEALVVCDREGRIIWANASFCALYHAHDREQVQGSTMEAVYDRAWSAAGAAGDPRQARGQAILNKNLRFAGAPFEMPLPDEGWCRVIARPARDGAIFYAHIDISALKRYEGALQLTLDNAGRGIIRYDAEGLVLLFNRQALELLDLPEQMLAGPVRLADLVQFQIDRGDFRPDERLPGQSTRPADPPGASPDIFASNQYLRRTRAGRVLEISTHPLPDGGAVRTYSDVTAYVEAQHALSEKSRALEITLDSMSQGIAAIDSTGRVTFWNRRYQELLQLPESLLASRPTMDQVVRFQIDRGDFGPDFELVDPGARHYVAIGDKLAPMQGPETYVRKTPDGRTFDVNTRPQPDGGVVRTFTDITAYVKSQEQLAYKQVQLGALVQNLPDRVWLKDIDGVYLLTNPAHQRYHGLPEAAILGRTAPDLFGPERGNRQAESDRRALASDTPITFEDYDLGRDGTLHCAEVIKVAMRDEHGQSIGLLGIARDITVRKQEEAALIKAKEEAQEASGAKSRFLSSMSHEIRTPMNAVLGMLTLLRGTDLSARQDDYAGKAEGAARALLSLLNDILDFSKIEAGKMRLDRRPFSLEGMLSDLSVILSSNVGDRAIEVLYDLDPQVPDGLVADDMRLRQILINLGGNAVKFTERGEVVVRTRLLERHGDEVVVEFSVQDTGIGLTPEQQKRLFSDYVQATDETARQFGGTGLGLGICRRLTDLMGSSLQLASTPGVGSRFWFAVRLPVSEVQPAPGPVPTGRAQPRRVLIVDDNALARDTLAALARSSGWQADTAQDGEQAVARIKASAAVGLDYDAVFVDWVMPELDGWQTCARIRGLSLPARPPLVIMVTAHGRDMLDRRPAHEQGMLDGFLVKPVTAGMLRSAMEWARKGPKDLPPSAAITAAQPLAGLTLLLAEDNLVNQQIAMELLGRQGARVDVVENGRAALDRLARQPYDAVLMDVQMPVMDGLAATRELRLSWDADMLPVIAMTANAMDSDRENCLAAGMNDHVAKPFVIEEVVRAILKHVAPHQFFGGSGGGSQAAARGATGGGNAGATQAPPARAALPVFDRADALDRLGGDEGLLRTVLPVLRSNLETSAGKLAASDHSSPEELAKLMHSIKGMAANLGAKALASVASEAETAFSEAAGPGRAALVDRVATAISELLRELERA